GHLGGDQLGPEPAGGGGANPEPGAAQRVGCCDRAGSRSGRRSPERGARAAPEVARAGGLPSSLLRADRRRIDDRLHSGGPAASRFRNKEQQAWKLDPAISASPSSSSRSPS